MKIVSYGIVSRFVDISQPIWRVPVFSINSPITKIISPRVTMVITLE